MTKMTKSPQTERSTKTGFWPKVFDALQEVGRARARRELAAYPSLLKQHERD